MEFKAFWKILRPIDCFMAVVAVFAGFIVSSGLIFVSEIFFLQLFFGFISVFVICGAGIVLNDFFDAEIDKINSPNRPIPSGKISKKTALIYSVVLFAIGLLLSFFINFYVFVLAVLNIVLEVLYAWKFKKSFFIGNLVDSWFPSTSFVFGALIFGKLETVLWLTMLAFLANLGREIYGDLEDVEGDLKSNAKTMPLVLGETKSLFFARLFTIGAVLLSFVPFVLGLFNSMYLIVVFLADLLFVYSLTLEPSKNQAVTKGAMVIAMLAFIVGVL